MEIKGVQNYKLSLLKNNRVEIILGCEDQNKAIEVYEILKQCANNGEFNLKFEVVKK